MLARVYFLTEIPLFVNIHVYKLYKFKSFIFMIEIFTTTIIVGLLLRNSNKLIFLKFLRVLIY